MREIRSPSPLRLDRDERSVFLAGSIEMGAAVDWQSQVTRAFSLAQGRSP